jgi:hypothetical protein
MSPSSSLETDSGQQVFLNPSELNELSALPFVRPAGVETIKLGGRLSESPERAQWEGELNRHLNACGCDAGAVGLVFGLLLWRAWGEFGGNPGAVAGTLFAVAGALAGKMVGRLRAHERLKETIREIQEQWGERE